MAADAVRLERGSRVPPVARDLATAGVARLVGFVPLALFAALNWADLLEPSARSGMLVAVVAATLAGGGLLLAAPRLDGRARVAAGAGTALALLVVALLAAGIPLRLLVPDAWDELADGIAQGASSMPAISIPYRGADEWVRSAFVAGGAALAGLGALLAFWPRSRAGGVAVVGFPLAAAVALGALYAIPVIQHNPDSPFLSGAAFCVLLGLFLGLERLRDDQVGVGIACVVVATGVGMLAAPRLDAVEPWLDYEQIAEDLQPERAASFSWDHSYAPLNWPRDGREILRIRARQSAYWKTVNLGDFDGVRWIGESNVRRATDTEFATRRRDWFQTVRVVDRGLRSRQFVGAGFTTQILPDGPAAVSLAPGTFQTVRGPLEPGTSYRAETYVPRPSERELRRAGTDYPGFVGDELSIDVPDRDPGIAPATVRFPAFGDDGEPAVLLANGFQPTGGLPVLERSSLGRVYDLARSLRADAADPYEFVQLVRERVQTNATYSESPRPSRDPLVDFLFNTHEGYCQQFSGAMALLLRMGGVPARVASGFSPGRFDRKRGEYIVRDDDAHSWVEAYFPRIGWYTLDPTPAASPARSQLTDSGPAPSAGPAPNAPALGQAGDRPFAPGDPGAIAAPDQGGADRTLLIVLAALAVLALGGGLLAMRRGRVPGEPPPPELAELVRALHRTGRAQPASMTLARLERTLGGTEAATSYLRAVRDQRFGGSAGVGPTPAQRRALRHELASGLGLRGRVRAWWALPPVPLRRRGASYTD